MIILNLTFRGKPNSFIFWALFFLEDDIHIAWMWTPHTYGREKPSEVSQTVFFSFILKHSLSLWLQRICLWVILTLTEEGRGVKRQCISQTLSHWWMKWLSSHYCHLCSAALVKKKKWGTCLSLFNDYQVPSRWPMCLCMHIQGRGTEIVKKTM